MNASRFLGASLGIGLAALVGCSSDALEKTDDATGATSTAPSTVSATVATRTLANVPAGDVPTSPGCHVDSAWPIVEVPGNSAATEAINAAIGAPTSIAELCRDHDDQEDAELTTWISGTFEVGANATGLLSLMVVESFERSGYAHPSHLGKHFTFDLRTGATLKLSQILEPSALARVREECTDSNGCDDSFLVERNGLRFFPTSDLRMGGEGIDHPWSQIKGALKPGPVFDYYRSLGSASQR